MTEDPTHPRLPPTPPLIPSNIRIRDRDEQDFFIKQYRAAWGLPPSVTHFAGPAPVSLNRDNIKGLFKQETCVSLKADGVRYLLLLTRAPPPQSEPVALFVDRSMNFYEASVWGHKRYFGDINCPGSLFDGELVWSYENYKPHLKFFVFDVMRIAGELVTQRTYAERMRTVTERVVPREGLTDTGILERDALVAGADNLHGLTLCVKQIHPIEQLPHVWHERSKAQHKNDGLIFQSNKAHVEIGTSSTIYKWKAMHTVDVLARRADDTSDWKAYAQSGSEVVPLNTIHHNGSHLNVLLQPNGVLTAWSHVVECECTIGEKEITLFPLKERIDKQTANSLFVIERTLMNIAESVSIQELLDAALTSRHQAAQ